MTDGKRLPLADIRRIGLMVQDYEAGNLGPRTNSAGNSLPTDGLLPFVLLESYRVIEESGEDANASYGKAFSAMAAQMAPTKQRVQVLRQTPGRPENAVFRLSRSGTTTADLRCNMTTDQIRGAIEGLPDLKDEVELIGKGDTLGPRESESEYQGKQWHIRFSENIEGSLLSIDQAADNARLFVDFSWPTNTVRRVIPCFPMSLNDLSPGAFIRVQSDPAFGWVQIGGECYRV